MTTPVTIKIPEHLMHKIQRSKINTSKSRHATILNLIDEGFSSVRVQKKAIYDNELLKIKLRNTKGNVQRLTYLCALFFAAFFIALFALFMR